MKFIPSVHHRFYENLRSSTQALGGQLLNDVSEDDFTRNNLFCAIKKYIEIKAVIFIFSLMP